MRRTVVTRKASLGSSPRRSAPVGSPTRPRVRVRVLADSVVAIGPGKADLLDAIAATGSISAAAREMGMSYRRAWILVDTMNACFRAAVVSTEKGGVAGGGASLTPTGRKVLAEYRTLADAARKTFAELLRAPRPAR